MSFNLASKVNSLAADQDDIVTRLNYLTTLAPNDLSNLNAIANSSNNDPHFYQTISNALNLKADQATTYTKTETDKKITDLVNGAPEVLNTLGELSQALNNQSDFGSVVLNNLAGKQPLISAPANL